jgi:glycine cleavage system H protein
MANQFNPDQYIHIVGDTATIGFTEDSIENTYNYSVSNLQINSNKLNTVINKSEVYGTFFYGNTVTNLEIPVSGTLLEINPLLNTKPMTVNTDPEGKGWLVRIRLSPEDHPNLAIV